MTSLMDDLEGDDNSMNEASFSKLILYVSVSGSKEGCVSIMATLPEIGSRRISPEILKYS